MQYYRLWPVAVSADRLHGYHKPQQLCYFQFNRSVTRKLAASRIIARFDVVDVEEVLENLMAAVNLQLEEFTLAHFVEASRCSLFYWEQPAKRLDLPYRMIAILTFLSPHLEIR